MLDLRLMLDGVDVVTSGDGADAMSALEKRQPDVVVTDLDMPVMDGLELIQHIRRDASLRETPILLLTGTPDAPRAVEALTYPKVRCMKKPPRFDDLAPTLRDMVEMGKSAD